jgi:hypothetical protein
VQAGYARWAESYDGLPNALILLQERVVQPLLAQAPA